MQTQSSTVLEQHWRTKGVHEGNYNHIIQNDGDRYPFMEEFMGSVVTDQLKKTAKSYGRKRRLNDSKNVAKKAAKRMVHGDIDPWRKKNESYGFLLAKSMIIMNAEIQKERMKPKNIYKNIGRDNMDYAIDRAGGKVQGWNYNTINAQVNKPRVQSVRGKGENVDDSLMRATGPTQARETTASFANRPEAELTDANVMSYEDFANIEVLEKEFALGKDLLDKAIEKIDDNYVGQLREHDDASEHDITIGRVFLNFLWMLNENDGPTSLENWEEVSHHFNESLPEQLEQVADQIEDRRYDTDKVRDLREEFKMKGDDEEEKGLLHNIKEVLCEAFCLIEILEELYELKDKCNNMDRTRVTRQNAPEGDESHMRDTNMFSFGTPAKDNQSRGQMTSAGKSVHFMASPEGMGQSPIDGKSLGRSASTGKTLYDTYPCKSPNERLIDIKNSTWRTKLELSNQGTNLYNKMLYTLGPRESYVVDRTFDQEMNFLALGQLSHDGELVCKKKGERQYVVDIDTGYNNEHAQSKSKITNDMRSKLYEDMGKEHEVVVSSPTKYPRKYQ